MPKAIRTYSVQVNQYVYCIMQMRAVGLLREIYVI